MCHELATQVNTSLWGQNELHNDSMAADELFTRRLPLKIGNEQRCGCHQAATATNIMHAHRLTQKNIEFLSFDMQQKMNSTMRMNCISWCLKIIVITKKIVFFFHSSV